MATYNVTDNFVTPALQPGDKLICSYSGNARKVTLPFGKYKLECWGSDNGSNGYGGYSVGDLLLVEDTVLWLRCGGRPAAIANDTTTTSAGGWNGGGNGYRTTYGSATTYGRGGGGATDVRITTDDVYHRVIVAGGAGGYNSRMNYNCYGGGETAGECNNSTTVTATGITGRGTPGTGANGVTNYNYGGSGGGGGYYGGTARYSDSGANYQSAGGTGFVYTDEFITSLFDYWALDEKYKLTNAKTVGGNQTVPVPNSTSTRTGRAGDGVIIITVLDNNRANERAIYLKRDGVFYRYATFKN